MTSKEVVYCLEQVSTAASTSSHGSLRSASRICSRSRWRSYTTFSPLVITNSHRYTPPAAKPHTASGTKSTPSHLEDSGG